MALDKFTDMSPQAVRVFNKYVQRVIQAIDDAANEMADYPTAAYLAFLDEIEGAVVSTINRLRDEAEEE